MWINWFFSFNFGLFKGKVCAEFNDGGKSIQRHIRTECKTCPEVYPSNDSYKCKKIFL